MIRDVIVAVVFTVWAALTARYAGIRGRAKPDASWQSLIDAHIADPEYRADGGIHRVGPCKCGRLH